MVWQKISARKKSATLSFCYLADNGRITYNVCVGVHIRAMEKTELMTGYEKRIYNGWKKSAADLLKDNKMVATALRNCLGVEVERKLVSGETVNLPLVYDLLIELLAFWKQNPDKIDLKVLSTVLGETKTEVDVNGQINATEVFRGVTAGAKPNGSNSQLDK